MALKRSSLALLASALVALIAYGPALQAEAAPIDRLLALIPSSQQHNGDSAPLQPPPQPSLGRAQIRPIGQRQPSFRPSAEHSTGPSSSQIPLDTSASVWYLLHQAQQRQQLQQQKMQSILSVRIQQQQQQLQQQTQTQQPQQQQQASPPETWSDRTLGGHAVLDDDDDDAGNELLDTESDGLLRPDADDEIEGTIEGEVLEEEEGYGNESEIEYDDGEDDDSNDGNLYEPWLTMPPSRLTHREARRTRLAKLRGEDEKGF
ncbi:hypothetical protein KI688_000821 [Linnemannia hyalina]|uniref:Uncharacterized protein n=1 Tax=Linnemannia hyalina TaxID=64524 RepID=A0A9P7Y459_9FUNG|nr:hypothetical protein KI688_000821 [Linnemannia hyalina]